MLFDKRKVSYIFLGVVKEKASKCFAFKHGDDCASNHSKHWGFKCPSRSSRQCIQLGPCRKAKASAESCVVCSGNRRYRDRAFDGLCLLPKVQHDTSARFFYMQLPSQRNLQSSGHRVCVCKHGRWPSGGL